MEVKVAGQLGYEEALIERDLQIVLQRTGLTMEELASLSAEQVEELGLGSFLKKVAKKLVSAVTGKGDDEKKEGEGEGVPGVVWNEDDHPRNPDGTFKKKPGENTVGSELPVLKFPVNAGGIGAGRKGEDPFVTDYNGKKVLIESTDGSDLKVSYVDLKTMETTGTVDIPAVRGEKNVWAPELHKIDGKWNIFYTSTGESGANEDHRMFVLQGGRSPFDPYTRKSQIGPPDLWGIDASPFRVGKKNYVTWSGWDSQPTGAAMEGVAQGVQHLFVAELKKDKKGAFYTGSPVKISSPEGWEGDILEGPQTLRDPKGGLVLTYSGNKSWSTDYSLGAIKLKGDPLKAASWRKHPKPLARNVGHGSWVGDKHVFHAKTTEAEGWDDRELRVASYRWVNGLPVLDIPE